MYPFQTSVLPVVAPRAGAWIETRPPGRLRGAEPVAPRAGALIETPHLPYQRGHSQVAPRAGAWIETYTYCEVGLRMARRSPRGGVD